MGAEMPDAGRHDRAPPQPPAIGFGSLAAVRDQQVAQMFRGMRQALKVPRETIARRLATSPSTIDNFEAGAIAALPHWRETSRIVRGYCELVRMDPEPILWRIRDQLQAMATQVPQAGPPPPRVLLRQAAVPGAADDPALAEARTVSTARPPRRRQRVRTLFALSAPVAFLAAVAVLLQVMPTPVYRVAGLLPAGLEPTARAGLDYIALLTAPRRDGLRWIEVSDPRLRKADKLQTSRR
jgi:hypothetical protein